MRVRLLVLLTLFVAGASAQSPQPIPAPHFWNDRDLSDWATPIAALNVRPGHVSEREYYAAPAGEWVRTYPVYFPGREPAGYWDMLRAAKPQPLLKAGPRTAAEWIADGQHVFEEFDVPAFRSTDPELIATVRSADAFTRSAATRKRTDGSTACGGCPRRRGSR